MKRQTTKMRWKINLCEKTSSHNKYGKGMRNIKIALAITTLICAIGWFNNYMAKETA